MGITTKLWCGQSNPNHNMRKPASQKAKAQGRHQKRRVRVRKSAPNPTGRKYKTVLAMLKGEGFSKELINQYMRLKRKQRRCPHKVVTQINDYLPECAACGTVMGL